MRAVFIWNLLLVLHLIPLPLFAFVFHNNRIISHPIAEKIISSSLTLKQQNIRWSKLTMSSQIKVTKSTTDELERLRVKTWSSWSCGVSKFPWEYDSAETAYFVKGKVIVTPVGGTPVTIEQGDLVVFPGGLACTWDVLEPISKHYQFGW